ncbi:SurA N-terminal domain-containing protein [Omnitrophica bacterium]|nr:SurA N-terminal domain-containing protein [Candidatus Omnitrophota bacterium]
MLFKRKRMTYSKYILLMIPFIFLSLSCAKKPPSEKIAVRISDYSITAGEFNELFSDVSAEDTPEARDAFLDNLITRKLLLKEAQKMGLDREKDFLKSIESFWEQSLLKIVIDKKISDVSQTISISNQEVEEYYRNWARENPDNIKTLDEMRDIMRWQLSNKKRGTALGSWVEELKDEASIEIDKKAIGIK